MEIYEKTGGSTEECPGVLEIGKAVGLSSEEAHLVASYWHEKGWIKYVAVNGFVRLTITGLEEIERLKQGWWRRTLADPAITGAIAGAVAGGLVNLLAEIAKWLLGIK